jgi:cephalosporin-C deacetylase
MITFLHSAPKLSTRSKVFRVFGTLTLPLFLASSTFAQQLQVTPTRRSGVYTTSEKFGWDIKVSGENTASVTTAHYQVKKGGATVVGEGDLDLSKGVAHLEMSSEEAASFLAEIKGKSADGRDIRALGGAVVAPDAIKPSLPRPADFDAFWSRKLAELAAVPAEPVLEAVDSEREGVEYWKVTLNNIRGGKIRAQMARPTGGTKLPAMVILQWAGVYGLSKRTVTDRAAEGWLVINVMPHELPIDESPEFYRQAGATILRDYNLMGNSSRESSYFLRMLLSCIRSADYLTQRPDWDGRTLVATGTSQGGFQSIALAGLDPRISAVMVNVPAGCDHTSRLVGRATPWPYWLARSTKENEAAVIEASRYYDPVNFATKIRVPVLVSLGLIDVTSTPSGVLAMANNLAGPKERVILPLADHQGANGTQAEYHRRSAAWTNALREGKQPPLQSGP